MSEATIFVEKIYNEYYDSLRRMCWAKIHHDSAYIDLIDETLQEVFLLAYQNYDNLKNHPNVLGWLMITCNHQLLPYAKQQRYRQNHHAFSMDDNTAPPIESGIDVSQQVIDQDMAERILSQVIKNLSEKERKVFDGFFIKNQSVSQISSQTGQSKNSVSAMIYQIRKKIRNMINKNFLFCLIFCILFYCI